MSFDRPGRAAYRHGAFGTMQTAVFLLNMGGPDSMEAVEPFLANLFSDPAIIDFPLAGLVRRPLARMIAARRAKKVAVHYEAMGGKSPLPGITAEQASRLEDALGQGFSVHVAMRYWRPTAEEAVKEAVRRGMERAVILPLYPQYCRATTGSSIADLENELKRAGLAGMPRRTVSHWEDFPPYVEALSECVGEAVKMRPDTFILWSAHGIPVKLIERGDPYLEHVKATVGAVMAGFPGNSHLLAFQSRTGPVEWLKPSTDEALKSIAAGGVDDVTVVAVSFVSDHIETLREIDVEYAELARGLGIAHFERAPSLNARPGFIKALAGLVRRETALFT